MRDLIALFMIAFGVAQFCYFGYNIYTLLVLFVFAFAAGILGGLDTRQADTSDSDALSTLAQIERNRYHRKHDQ